MDIFVVWTTMLYFLVLARPTISLPIDHIYNAGDDIPLFASKVGPLNNPSETYNYFDLPFCKPDEQIKKDEYPWMVLNISHLANTLHNMKFKEQKVDEVLCSKTMSRNDVSQLRNAIARDFYFQMYFDDLPFWGFIGKVDRQEIMPNTEGVRYYLFNHIQFSFLYNDNHVIEVLALGDPNHAVDLTEDADIDVKFSYSVKWKPTTIPFQSRMERYSRASYLPPIRQLRWFSLMNLVVITVVTIGLFMVIHNWTSNSGFKSGDEEGGKGSSCAFFDGGVFRTPLSVSLFCALLGCGAQLFILVCCLFLLALLGFLHFYNIRTLWMSAALIYNMTSLVGGYTAASLHCQFAETNWVKSVKYTGLLSTGLLSFAVFTANGIAKSSGVSSALPFSTFGCSWVIYIATTMPLLLLGGFIGHRSSNKFPAPTRRSLREMPPTSDWYKRPFHQIFFSGLLAFSAILIELHQLYLSLWSYKIYTVPSFLLITFSILLLLTVILSIGWTRVQLHVDSNSQWWWRSIFHGGSVAFFVFLYGIYFYCKSNMSGVFQFSIFLCFHICFCYGLFLMLGAISFGATFIFVHRAYHVVKSE